ALELAALDRARHGAAHRRHHALDHLVVIELRELREALSLGDDEPDDVLAPGPEDLAYKEVGDRFADGANRQIGQAPVQQAADERRQESAHQLLEQALLVA